MYVVVPHVGKSHLTRETLASIPDEHRIILVDASYVADLDVYAANHASKIEYVRPENAPQCLAANWNLGADFVPETEAVWLFCASDVQFYAASWRRLAEQLRRYPDAGIVRDKQTNWNVWAVRRWAWNLLAPMDERYKPCGGEDDDLVAKCHHAGIRIRAGWIGVNHLEGGHATRLDIKRKSAGTDWSIRHKNIHIFRRKWGCEPALSRDDAYRKMHAEVHIAEKRTEPPADWNGHCIPVSRKPWPERTWPTPLRVNIGCGRRPIEGWVNTDADEASQAQVVFDAAGDEWPFEDGSVEEVAAYHVFEHLDKAGSGNFLARAKRALKSGGRLVIECPDLLGICARFHKNQNQLTREIYGNQTTPWQSHRYGYSRDTIKLVLEEAGFRVTSIGDGTDYHFHPEKKPAFRAEAVKP